MRLVQESPVARHPGVPGVLVVSGSVGAGHDAAAAELAARLRRAGVAAVVQDLLTALPTPLRRLVRDAYGPCVNRVPVVFELLVRGLERDGAMWWATRRIAAAAAPAAMGWVGHWSPDLIVCTHPLAAQTFGDLSASGRIDVPVLTYLTDPAVHRSWLHPAATHLTAGAATALQGDARYGVPMTVAGPLVPARFAQPVPAARVRRVRTELGLPEDRPVALVVAGSLGLGDLGTTAADLLAAGATPLVLCGRGEARRRRTARRPGVVALGWRDDVPDLMAAADVLVHNAGGMACTEALVAGLPMITHRPIPGHGRANAAVLAAAGLAPWTTTRAELTAAVHAATGLGRPRRTRVPHPDPADLVLRLLAGATSVAA